MADSAFADNDNGNGVAGEDEQDRQERSRERNREHAKKTRLRKKVLIEGMKDRLLDLQNEVCLRRLIFCGSLANAIVADIAVVGFIDPRILFHTFLVFPHAHVTLTHPLQHHHSSPEHEIEASVRGKVYC